MNDLQLAKENHNSMKEWLIYKDWLYFQLYQGKITEEEYNKKLKETNGKQR